MEFYETIIFSNYKKFSVKGPISLKSFLSGEFCSNHLSAVNTFKWYTTEDQKFSEWYKHCSQNPLLKKKGIPECILFVTQRLTKYPLLIQPLLKSSVEDKIEHEKLTKAYDLVKNILTSVDSRVAEKGISKLISPFNNHMNLNVKNLISL